MRIITFVVVVTALVACINTPLDDRKQHATSGQHPQQEQSAGSWANIHVSNSPTSEVANPTQTSPDDFVALDESGVFVDSHWMVRNALAEHKKPPCGAGEQLVGDDEWASCRNQHENLGKYCTIDDDCRPFPGQFGICVPSPGTTRRCATLCGPKRSCPTGFGCMNLANLELCFPETGNWSTTKKPEISVLRRQ